MKTLTSISIFSTKVNYKSLLKYIAIPLIVGIVAALFTSNSMKTFDVLNKPALSPPSWLFPVAWTILYTLMGISAYIISISNAEPIEKAKSLTIYTYQLAVNFLWPILFFNFQWYVFSFLWILLLILLVFLMIKSFYKINKTAAYLNIPYLLWLMFAAYLNFSIWFLNR